MRKPEKRSQRTITKKTKKTEGNYEKSNLGKVLFHSVSKLNLVALKASACCSTVSLTIFQKHSATAKERFLVVSWVVDNALSLNQKPKRIIKWHDDPGALAKWILFQNVQILKFKKKKNYLNNFEFLKNCSSYCFISDIESSFLPRPVTTAKYPSAFIGNNRPERIFCIYKR